MALEGFRVWLLGACGRCVPKHILYKAGAKRRCPGCGEAFVTVCDRRMTFREAEEELGRLHDRVRRAAA
jgi:PHP family Zn ribbon phosphoesterase